AGSDLLAYRIRHPSTERAGAGGLPEFGGCLSVSGGLDGYNKFLQEILFLFAVDLAELYFNILIYVSSNDSPICFSMARNFCGSSLASCSRSRMKLVVFSSVSISANTPNLVQNDSCWSK